MLEPGTILGGYYKIIRLLGIGGFGETYEAEDLKRFNCLCVVKRLRPQINYSALEITRRLFDREARTLRELGDEHEQIPQLYAYFEENQEFYLVQEYIEGATLTEILFKRTLSEFEVINLLKQVLKILDFIHNHNNRIIHRDIKPANLIRRTKDNKIVLIDFGAVKQTFKEALNDSSTVAIGTPDYMPLEQIQKRPLFCSDIYALGIVGIQALTGSHPAKLTRNLETDNINELVNINISSGLRNILNNMVRTQSSQRYQSAIEVLEALEELESQSKQISLNFRQVSPQSPDTQIPFKKNNQRLLRFFKSVLAGLILVSLFSIVSVLANNPPLVCILNSVPDGNFSYSGSTTWQLFRDDVEKSIENTCPQFKLSFSPRPGSGPGSGYGIESLLKGQVDFAISSRSISSEENELAKNQGTVLIAEAIAIDGISIGVNHNLPIDALTINQLRDILTGTITDWNQIGVSKSLKINVYKGKNSSVNEILKLKVLGNNKLREDVTTIDNAPGITEAMIKVFRDQSGLILVSSAHLARQCQGKALTIGTSSTNLVSPYKKPLVSLANCTPTNRNQPNVVAFKSQTYPLTNRLFVIYNQNNLTSKQVGEAYIKLLKTAARRKLIEKAGFVAI